MCYVQMTLVQPSQELQSQIRKELNEDVTRREKDLEHIKDWLSRQPHLPQIDDDQRLMSFLRGCKFSTEKTKRKIDMYFTMRGALPEFFTNRDVRRSELKQLLEKVAFPPMPKLTPEGRRVVVMQGKVKDYTGPLVPEGMMMVLMIGDIRIMEEEGVAGDVYVLDASVATPYYFAKFTPMIVKRFLVCVQEAYPVKLKEVHIINVHPLVDAMISFAKPFLKEKIRNRIFVHPTLDSLYKYVPKDVLPSEYGGYSGPIDEIHRSWIKKMEQYTEWFKNEEQLVTDESRRPGKPKTHDDLFGVEGSFRKLDID